MSNFNDQLKEKTKEIYSQEVIDAVAESVIEANRSTVTGLQIGDTAPDFTLPNENDETISLYSKLEQGPVVLSFYRGDWCAFCNMELQSFAQIHGDIQKKGASLLAVHTQTNDRAKDLITKHSLDFDILCDEKLSTITAYNVRFEVTQGIKETYLEYFDLDITEFNVSGTWELPVPAVFVIDSDKIIKSRYFNYDYTKRMEPSDVLKALDNLPDTTDEPSYD